MKTNPEQRWRFNLREKLALAISVLAFNLHVTGRRLARAWVARPAVCRAA